MVHYLKIKRNFLNDIITNKKNFEIRRDDRNFAIGDLISFIPLSTDCTNCPTCKREEKPFFLYCPTCKREASFLYEGFFLYEITYKLNYLDFPEGIKKNYCVLGIRKKTKTY